MLQLKKKIEHEKHLSLNEERRLIQSKNLPLLKKYFRYSFVHPNNQVQLVYSIGDSSVFRTYIQTYGIGSVHAQAACAKLCPKKTVKCMIKDEISMQTEVEKELLKRGDDELLRAYEAKWGPIAVNPQ